MKIITKVINLDRREDRFNKFLSEIAKTDLTNIVRFSALNGINIVNEIYNKGYSNDIIMHELNKKTTTCAVGELGCTLSHYFLLKEISTDDTICDDDIICIFEDDAFFKTFNIADILTKINEKLELVDIMYIGGRFTPHFIPSTFNFFSKVDENIYIRVAGNGLDYDRCTTGYMVKKSKCMKICDAIIKFISHENKCYPIDHIFTAIQTSSCIMSAEYFPHFVFSPMHYETDIQQNHKRNTISLNNFVTCQFPSYVVKYINLDKRIDRNNMFLDEIKKAHIDKSLIERFSAIYGKTINQDVINKNVQHDEIIGILSKLTNICKLAEMGCTLSHYFLLKQIAHDELIGDKTLILICEDDAFFSDINFNDVAQSINDNLDDFDMVYIGGRFIPNFTSKLSEHSKIKGNIYGRNEKKHRIRKGHNHDRCTTSYIVSKLSAQKLYLAILNYFVEINGNDRLLPIDKIYGRLEHLEIINTYDWFPHIVHSPESYMTDIQGRANSETKRSCDIFQQ
jgi:GR25 family glycosyltransferase involved in LPS biosynthesis